MPTKDITGQRFGKLVALRPLGSKGGHMVWLCKCDCGNEHEALSHNLIQGTVKSCGCLVRESNRKKAKHGMHETRLYRVWAAVKIRCASRKKMSDSAKNRADGHKKSEEYKREMSKRCKDEGRTVPTRPPVKLIDENGNVYDSVRQASEATGINYHTLWNQVKGRRTNRSGLKIYE